MAKVINVEDLDWYYVKVQCPYCGKHVLVKGDTHSYGVAPAAMECFFCREKSWLGEYSAEDYGPDIEDNEIPIALGFPPLEGM